MARKKKVENAGTGASQRGGDAERDAMVALLQKLIGGVEFAQTPIGPPMQPPMRGRPYTSYNRSRVPNQNTPGVGPMGNLPFQANITAQPLSFPPMYGMPRTPQGGSGPVVGEDFRFLPPTL